MLAAGHDVVPMADRLTLHTEPVQAVDSEWPCLVLTASGRLFLQPCGETLLNGQSVTSRARVRVGDRISIPRAGGQWEYFVNELRRSRRDAIEDMYGDEMPVTI